jgi:hypothetical protein
MNQADLTGGHPHEAPAWGRQSATENQREVYRRFLRELLPGLCPALIAYRDTIAATGQQGVAFASTRPPDP